MNKCFKMWYDSKAITIVINKKKSESKHAISTSQVKHYIKVKSCASILSLTHLSLKIDSDEKPV